MSWHGLIPCFLAGVETRAEKHPALSVCYGNLLLDIMGSCFRLKRPVREHSEHSNAPNIPLNVLNVPANVLNVPANVPNVPTNVPNVPADLSNVPGRV